MLVELHNQGQDRFVYTCNECKHHVETRWHCTVCEVSWNPDSTEQILLYNTRIPEDWDLKVNCVTLGEAVSDKDKKHCFSGHTLGTCLLFFFLGTTKKDTCAK